MTARHRVSSCCCVTAASIRKPTTWTAAHRRWLSAQQFDEPASDAGVRRPARRRRRPDVAQGGDRAERCRGWRPMSAWWPTVARLRCFRGIDTLTALAFHLELGGDWQRFQRAPALGSWLGLTPSLSQSGESSQAGLDHQDRLHARPAAAGRSGLALQPPAAARRDAAPTARPASPTTSSQIANRAQQRLLPRPPQHARPRQAAQRHRRRVRARAGLLPLGGRDRRLTPGDSLTRSVGRGAGPSAAGTRESL